MTATLDLNIFLEMFRGFDLKAQKYLLEECGNIVESKKTKRTFEDIEVDLWNGKTVSKEEAVEFLERYRDDHPNMVFTQEELQQQVVEAEKAIANGETTDDEEVEKCFDALFKSL